MKSPTSTSSLAAPDGPMGSGQVFLGATWDELEQQLVQLGDHARVRGDDMVEHGLNLSVEQLGRLRLSGKIGVEHVPDLGPDQSHGGSLAPPVEYQLVVQVREEPFRAAQARDLVAQDAMAVSY